MRRFILLSFLVMTFCSRLLGAETLNSWLSEQIKDDEQKLADSFARRNGYDVTLLKYAQTYVPFFIEAPEEFDSKSISLDQEAAFEAWLARGNRKGFLPGGYIYRLNFADAPPLYATSAGDRDGTIWHSLDLGKDFVVEPSRVWNGCGDDYLFATRLYGVPPKIVVYDQQGEVKREEAFDVNAADLEQRVAAAEQAYAEKGSPNLEMLSLAEYLENPFASWREVDLSGQFNLRNQQQRDTERERLKPCFHLTRNAALEALQSKSSPQEPQRPRASSETIPALISPKPIKSHLAEPASVEECTVTPRWSAVVALLLIVAAAVLLWIWFKKRK